MNNISVLANIGVYQYEISLNTWYRYWLENICSLYISISMGMIQPDHIAIGMIQSDHIGMVILEEPCRHPFLHPPFCHPPPQPYITCSDISVCILLNPNRHGISELQLDMGWRGYYSLDQLK